MFVNMTKVFKMIKIHNLEMMSIEKIEKLLYNLNW